MQPLVITAILLAVAGLGGFGYGLRLPSLGDIRQDFKRHCRFCRVSGILISAAGVVFYLWYKLAE
jgi:hypothetical protein